MVAFKCLKAIVHIFRIMENLLLVVCVNQTKV